MPSKRTNDSVDRILEDLNIQQAQAGLRDSVTDHQVDEILRSVGISTAPAQPVQGGFAFEADDCLVFGPETRGLPQEILALSPHRIRIPMLEGRVRSLNLSTSAGIVLYLALASTGLMEDWA